MLEKGYKTMLEDQHMKIYDQRGMMIIKAPMSSNRTFKIEIQSQQDQKCLSATKESKSWLCHMRYGHLNFKRLRMMSNNRVVTGIDSIQQPGTVCDSYCEAKQPRKSYKAEIATRTSVVLNLVHTYVCGPFEKASLRGSSYFVSFIDDYSRKAWIYLLNRKSEVFLTFKRLKAMSETQSGNKILKLRSDGGGEYTSHEFGKFYENEGIIHEITPPNTPQHNGVAKRFNRTLVNMTMCMLRNFHLPKEFWGEAVSTAVYLLNRSPTKKHEDVTPEEIWSGNKPDIKHLRVFGCLCFRHVPDQLRRKLDKKGEQMIMLGYHTIEGYRLYDCNSRKVVISSDVIFDEYRSLNLENITVKTNPRQQDLNFDLDESASKPAKGHEDVNHDISDQDSQNLEEVAHRRVKRTRVHPSRLQQYEVYSDDRVTDEEELLPSEEVHIALFVDVEPISFAQAVKERKWIEAMKEELQSIEKNGTWELVKLPKGKKAIGVKWVYKVKYKPNGEIAKYKARLVAKGFL